MAKKLRSHYLYAKVLLASVLTLTGASLLYFQPWQKSDIPSKTFSPDLLAHDVIPAISDEYPIIQHTFEKGDIQCITMYNITTSLPIYIKRHYPKENRTEYLILKPLDAYTEQITAMYELVQHSQEYIGRFESQVVDMYSSMVKTRYILSHKRLRMNKNTKYLSLGIWYRKEGESTERLIGSVTIDPHYSAHIPKGAYGSYFTGDPMYTGVRGIMRTSFEALVNYLIYKGEITGDIILVIDRNNKASTHIAEKLHFSAHEAKEHYPKTQWPYPAPIEDCLMYRISKEQWEKYNWRKRAVKREKVRYSDRKV